MLQQMSADDKPVAVEIWDAVGRTVYERNEAFVNGKVEIKMDHAVPGVYMIQITDASKQKQRFKLLVK